MVLFTKEYLPKSVLFFPSPNFPIMIVPTQVAWFQKSILYRFPSPSLGVCLEKGPYSGYYSSLCNNPNSSIQRFDGSANTPKPSTMVQASCKVQKSAYTHRYLRILYTFYRLNILINAYIMLYSLSPQKIARVFSSQLQLLLIQLQVSALLIE